MFYWTKIWLQWKLLLKLFVDFCNNQLNQLLCRPELYFVFDHNNFHLCNHFKESAYLKILQQFILELCESVVMKNKRLFHVRLWCPQKISKIWTMWDEWGYNPERFIWACVCLFCSFNLHKITCVNVHVDAAYLVFSFTCLSLCWWLIKQTYNMFSIAVQTYCQSLSQIISWCDHF